MNIVLDTNIIIASVYEHSPYHSVFWELKNGKYDLFVTNEILLEYEEKLSKKFGKIIANQAIDLLLLLKNVHKIETYYKFNVIYQDLDDNKFVDCAFAVNADYIVSNDHHFNILSKIDFSKN